jgi:hypothetical protein
LLNLSGDRNEVTSRPVLVQHLEDAAFNASLV